MIKKNLKFLKYWYQGSIIPMVTTTKKERGMDWERAPWILYIFKSQWWGNSELSKYNKVLKKKIT